MGNLGHGAYPTHPGEVIKDEIEARGITQRQLADSMGLTYSVVSEILNGRRNLSTKNALMIEAALGLPAEILLKLQLRYNMQTALEDKSFREILDRIPQIPSA